MAVTVIIPGRTHEEFGFSISKLIRVVDNLSSLKEKEITLDFSHARMLNPISYWKRQPAGSLPLYAYVRTIQRIDKDSSFDH